MAGWEAYQKYVSTKHTLDSTRQSNLCDTTIALTFKQNQGGRGYRLAVALPRLCGSDRERAD